MQIKSLGHIKDNLINKQIEQQFKFFKKIDNLGQSSILYDPNQSTYWIVSIDNIKIRPICGHRKSDGTVCFLSAGMGTEHSGFGFCSKHSSSPLMNISLSEQQNYPTRLKGLLERSVEIERSVIDSLEPEIRILSALLNYVLTFPEESDREELTIEEIETAQGLVKELVKAKALRQKLMREIQLDYKNVKVFIDQIFSIIMNSVDGPQARNIIQDIYNKVIVPYRNSSKLTGSDGRMSDKIQEVISKTGEDF
jgi:hypothetical protein